MNLDKKALAGFIQEIEGSRDRQKGETEFQRDVFKRAREKHFDVKAMRIVLQRRAMEPGKRDEQDYNVSAYEIALGAKKDAVEAMEQGASAREAAERYSLPRAAVTALKAGSENANFEPSHDADGVIIETEIAAPHGGGCHLTTPRDPQAAEAPTSPQEPVPQGGEGTGTHSDEAPATPSVGAVAAEPRVAPPFLGDDPGEIPAHLRGPSPANRSLRP
jgi:uncharacterized protein (UPF0335 family)